MISHKHKFIFFDIVKTGGSSINKVLEKYGGSGKHHSVSRPLPAIPRNKGLDRYISPELLKDYFTFTIARNPYDRLISLFGFCQTAPRQRKYAQSGWTDFPEKEKLLIANLREQNRETYWPTDIHVFIEWLVDYKHYFCDWTLEKYIICSHNGITAFINSSPYPRSKI